MNDNPKIDPVEIEVDDLPELETAGPLADAGQTRVELVANAVNRPRSRLAVWVFRVVVSLVLFASGVWAWDFVFGLLDRNLYLGGMALGLVALLIALLVAFGLRVRSAFLAALSLTAYSEFGLIVAAGIPDAEAFLVATMKEKTHSSHIFVRTTFWYGSWKASSVSFSVWH